MKFYLKIAAVMVLAAGVVLGLWLWLAPDPQKVFEDEIKEMVAVANEYRHPELREKFSAEAAAYVSENFLPLSRALILGQKMDRDGKFQYRFVETIVFEKGSYAEAWVDRSGRSGNFQSARKIRIPFVYQDGEWKVASGFKDGGGLDDPYH